MSASESICTPNFDVAFSARAMPPVDAVEEGSDEHHDDGRLETAFIGQPDARQAGANRQNGDEIRHQQAQRDLADARAATAMRLEGLERFWHLRTPARAA